MRLSIPPELRRGGRRRNEEALVESGRVVLDLMKRRVGLTGYEDIDLLDVGCGCKVTQAILEYDIPIRSYVGVDVFRPLMDYLSRAITDPRFSFFHVDFENDMYNPRGVRMSPDVPLPIGGKRFPLISLFSVFTHLAPHDFEAMLRMLRHHIEPDGRLFFTAFIDCATETPFVDANGDQPLKWAVYGEREARRLIAESGWEILSFHPPEPHIQHHFVCRVAD